jgi:alpha-tubulin suppressor-like RCC1 family protein
VILVDNTIMATGYNEAYQLGFGDTMNRMKFEAIPFKLKEKQLITHAVSGYHILVIVTAGKFLAFHCILLTNLVCV